MLRPTNDQATRRRRAIILLVVLAMLTLFAIVGITFVYYAQGAHTASLNFREAPPEGRGVGPNISPDLLLNWALGQLIYDVPDNGCGLQSALRGHSFARTMYGWNDESLNVLAYNGTGRLHYPGAGGVDDYLLVNYTYFPTDGFLRDPERLNDTPRTGPGQPRRPYTGGFNPPYTYPDLNTMALAAVRADGTLLMPSFHRPWLLNQTLLGFDPATDQRGKYVMLRPHPLLNPNFPPLTDPNGDVKNLMGAPGGNDSIWIDLGFPVMTAPDGTRYKPLFAFLVSDLDGRLNLNIAGNIMGGPGMHGSNQGWGRWEMGLGHVLNQPPAGGQPPEWTYLFTGNPSAPGVPGRYGQNGLPANGGPAPGNGKQPRFGAQVDYNGWAEPPNGPRGPFTLPGLGFPFPSFPAANYNNGSVMSTELNNHARLFDFFRPLGPNPQVQPWDDRVFPVSDMKRLMVDGFRGTRWSLADVAQLCRLNFSDPQFGPRRRNMVTTLSMDVGRPGVMPWLFDRNDPQYLLDPVNPDLPPHGPRRPWAFPQGLAGRANPVPANSDFSADWRASLAAMGRVNLDQDLPSYPHQTIPPGTAAPYMGAHAYYGRFDDPQNRPQFLSAQAHRQDMAAQVYRRLLAVTGAAQPANPAMPTNTELTHLRWLAQLAVNIVDYIDEDEINTPFYYYAVAHAFYTKQPFAGPADAPGVPVAKTVEPMPKYWVFGTELPTVVLNEVLTEYQLPVDGNNNVMAGPFQVKVWAELLCPRPPASNAGTQPQDTQPTPLHIPAAGMGQQPISPYKVVLANTEPLPPAMPDPDLPVFPRPDNVLGTPDEIRNEAVFTTATVGTVAGPMPAVPTAINPAGFFLVGPSATVNANDRDGTIAAPRVPGATPWFQTAGMEYTVDFNPANANPWMWTPPGMNQQPRPINDNTVGVTVMLRRLANPHLPHDPNPVAGNLPNPLYNPYITVDYLDKVELNNATTPSSAYEARGKKQPYAAHLTQIADQLSGEMVKPDIEHTLGEPNVPPPGNDPQNDYYDWLVHLDRQVISPAELLHVSGLRPHRLTQMFITGAGSKFTHRVPWFDEGLATQNPPQSYRLYRLFEFLQTADRMAGVSTDGRRPGMININTVWEREVFRAIFDPRAAGTTPNPNFFDQTDVDALWLKLLARRTPGLLDNTPAWRPTGGTIGPADRPFLGMAAPDLPQTTPPTDPQAALSEGIRSTLFAPDPTDPTRRLFQVRKPTGPTAQHIYPQYEMLTKAYGNLTTRSNTFGVWLTVGFFEVEDETVQPVRLGREIGFPTRNVRHRFFAVVDRTALAVHPALTHSANTAAGAVPVRPQPNPPVWVEINPKAQPMDPLEGVAGSIIYSNSNSVKWAILPGSVLVVDRGTPREETVVVTHIGSGGQVTPTDPNAPANLPPNAPPPPGTGLYIRAEFIRQHDAGFTITMPGNPGPQPNFDPSNPRYAPVVPYVTRLP